MDRRSLLGAAAVAGLTTLSAPTASSASPSRSLRSRGVISLRDFGAIGDGKTDDSDAFVAAYTAACTSFPDNLSATALYVPNGRYLITRNNFLGSLDFSKLSGGNKARYNVTLFGDGWGSEIIFRPSSAADAWMYDNGCGESQPNRLVYPYFHNLRFTMDVAQLTDSATMNGFRIHGSPGHATQGFTFDRCRFVCVNYPGEVEHIARAGTLIKIAGTVNGDATKMVACKVRGLATLLDLDSNAEAVVHDFIGVDAEVMYGDVFKIGGGANVNVLGGSYTMMSRGPAFSYFVAVRPPSAIVLAGTHTFYGVRLELNRGRPDSYHSGLLLIDATSQPAAYKHSTPCISFVGCSFYPTSGRSRTTIAIDSAIKAKVQFNGCAFNDKHRLRVFSSKHNLQFASRGPFSEVDFIGGESIPFSNVEFVDGSSVARISSRGCIGTLDYDIGVTGAANPALGHCNNLKTAHIWGVSWPDSSAQNSMAVQLPPYAVIRSVRFRKSPGGSKTSDYQIYASDAEGEVIYCQSTGGPQNSTHEGFGNDLNVVCDTLAKQQVIIKCTPGRTGAALGTAMSRGDFAMVDYY